MKKLNRLIFLITIHISLIGYSQTEIYISHENGNDIGTSGGINDPVKTLERAEELITNPGNETYYVYLKNEGNIIPRNGSWMDWTKSGSVNHPIYITSSSCERATFSREKDCQGYYLRFRSVNYIHISNIKFDKSSKSGVLLDNVNNCSLKYCEFIGDSCEQTGGGAQIWIGSYVSGATSEYNNISNNFIHDVYANQTGPKNHGIYISEYAHNNEIFNNTIIDPAASGVHFWHGYNHNNTVTKNIIQQNIHNGNGYEGLILSYDPNTPCASVYGNSIYDNYVHDPVNSIPINVAYTCLAPNNTTSPNYFYSWDHPSDPYWLEYDPQMISDLTVSGDFDGDGITDIGAFYGYNNNQEARIHTWLGTSDKAFKYSGSNGWWSSAIGSTYDISKIRGRVVAGDFNGDGKDDIAAFYDMGSGSSKINIWLSTGTSFTNTGYPHTWWSSTSYNVNNITGRVIAGNFSLDAKDDIAVFYDYGNGNTRIHVWRTNSSGNAFYNNNPYTYWISGSGQFDASKITSKVVAGNFSMSNQYDDIAAFYDVGAGITDLRVWRTNNSGTGYHGNQYYTFWTSTSSYSASNITGRVVAGNFSSNNYDDISAFYDYGNGHTRIHTWRTNATGDGYIGNGPYTFWTASSGYSASKITGRVIAGNFENSGNDYEDIAAFYNYDDLCGSLRTHVWQSKDTSFDYINNSLGYPWLTQFAYFKSKPLAIDTEIFESEEYLEDVKVYPNPSNGYIFIEYKDFPFQFIVYDFQGKLILDKFISNDLYKFDTREFKNGIYAYKVVSKNKVESGKFIISD